MPTVTVDRGALTTVGDATHWAIFFSPDGVAKGPYGNPTESHLLATTQVVLDYDTEVPAGATHIATEAGNFEYPTVDGQTVNKGPISDWVAINAPAGAFDFGTVSIGGSDRRVVSIEAESCDDFTAAVGSDGWQVRTAAEGQVPGGGLVVHTGASGGSAIHAPDTNGGQTFASGDVAEFPFRITATENNAPLYCHFRWKPYGNNDRLSFQVVKPDGTTVFFTDSIGDGNPGANYDITDGWHWSRIDTNGNDTFTFTPDEEGIWSVRLIGQEAQVGVDKIVIVNADTLDMSTVNTPFGPTESTQS